jgi:hypothetical protein
MSKKLSADMKKKRQRKLKVAREKRKIDAKRCSGRRQTAGECVSIA